MITLYILHAGITHPSPYFYNFCKELKSYHNYKYIVNPNLPVCPPEDKGIIYFNRLKRFYDSNDMQTAKDFLNKIDDLKSNNWKIVWTLHNFFPIDRNITLIDEYVTKEFINKCDLVFTLSDCLKNNIKKYYGINAINHGMGFNLLDKDFNNNLVKNFETNKFVFTFIGNIYEYKMLDYVITNFNKLDNCILIIAGKEPKNAYVNIEKLIKKNKNIKFYDGFIRDDDWKKLSYITDSFINIYDLNFPAFKYGFFPSNFINIYNTGIQCISPRCKEIEEMMNENQMIYYSFTDKDGLLNAMKYAISRKYNKLNNNVNERYNWSNVVSCFTKNCERLFYED